MLTRDKVPVTFHDNELSRCTNGTGMLWDHSWEEIKQLDAGQNFSAATAGERIPMLSAVVQCCRELLVGLNLEVKHMTEGSSDVPTAAEQQMEEEIANVVCDTIEQCSVRPDELVFSSFSRPAIAVLRRRLPHFACAYLVEGIPDDWHEFMLHHHCESLIFQWDIGNPEDTIQDCARKVPCYAYTVNEGAVASQLMSLGVRGVISDCPHIVSKELCELGETAFDPHTALGAHARAAQPCVENLSCF